MRRGKSRRIFVLTNSSGSQPFGTRQPPERIFEALERVAAFSRNTGKIGV